MGKDCTPSGGRGCFSRFWRGNGVGGMGVAGILGFGGLGVTVLLGPWGWGLGGNGIAGDTGDGTRPTRDLGSAQN